MIEKKESKSSVVISKVYGKEHTVRLEKFGIDKERTIKFNKGEKITITKKELEVIGKHRWLEVENG